MREIFRIFRLIQIRVDSICHEGSRLNVQIFSSMHFFSHSISEIYGAFLHNHGIPHVLINTRIL